MMTVIGEENADDSEQVYNSFWGKKQNNIFHWWVNL